MIFSTVVSGQENELSKIRNLYQRAPERETAAKELLKITEDYRKEDPVLFAYKGAAHMMMAKHVINPFTKMSHFNKGKKIYSAAIEADPKNMELRFLRYSVQSEAPGFLGYKQNVEEDKTLLLKNTKQLQDPGLKKMIVEYLLSSDGLSSAEKEKLK
ncbi:hypothetical protein [Salinimicrobium soli]|uniref:hypothetical protein n=1 Tax=Salinimicrobium soli TaxID=1254399 RepID=UPI003AAE61FC